MHRIVRADLTEKVTLKQRFEGGDEVSHAGFQRKSHSGRGNSHCKSSEEEAHLGCLRNSRKADVARTEGRRGRAIRHKLRLYIIL